jgi:hypothetical protein
MKNLHYDLHVHTHASHDGLCTPAVAVRAAIKRGLSGIAVCDHNTNANVQAAREAAPQGFDIIPGVEYSTESHHVLALFCEPMFLGEKDERGFFSLAQVSAFVRGQGGLLVLAHPFQWCDTIDEAVLAYVDGLESVNARDLRRDPSARRRVEALAQKHQLFITGGSDAHLPQEIGGAYTQIPEGADLREAIKSGVGVPRGKAASRLYWAISRAWSRLR